MAALRRHPTRVKVTIKFDALDVETIGAENGVTYTLHYEMHGRFCWWSVKGSDGSRVEAEASSRYFAGKRAHKWIDDQLAAWNEDTGAFR